MTAMRRFLATFMVALVALMPLAGLTGQSAAIADTQEMPCHGPGPTQADTQSGGDCESCAGAHGCCAGAVMPLPWARAVVPGAARIRFGDSFASGFVPEQLVPPPLSL